MLDSDEKQAESMACFDTCSCLLIWGGWRMKRMRRLRLAMLLIGRQSKRVDQRICLSMRVQSAMLWQWCCGSDVVICFIALHCNRPNHHTCSMEIAKLRNPLFTWILQAPTCVHSTWYLAGTGILSADSTTNDSNIKRCAQMAPAFFANSAPTRSEDAS